MIPRIATHLLVRPEDVTPNSDGWEVIGTFNPGAARYGDEVVLLIRVAERPKERRAGWTALPRWSKGEGWSVDWVPEHHLEPLDQRVTRHRTEHWLRLTFISHLRVARSRDGRTIDRIEPYGMMPATPFEEFGVEDPRITRCGDRYYITYVAVSRHGPATALASTTDFQSFERHGIIFCPENKDVVLFPERIDNQYVALHRPIGGTAFSPPQMWIARSDDLIHWGEHQFLFGGHSAWETGRVGAGARRWPSPRVGSRFTTETFDRKRRVKSALTTEPRCSWRRRTPPACSASAASRSFNPKRISNTRASSTTSSSRRVQFRMVIDS